uniref:G-protein coupled receptors family 1 profile domain-containing protein n=1 Tax=Xenopus tropicalis TaxID=8364 RepID=A0A6I8SHC7_XENTR
MDHKNKTVVKEFIFAGLSENPKVKPFLFVLFLIIYSLTWLENSALISVIASNEKLHTPMYIFVSQLSLIDICYSSSISINTLVNLICRKRSISVSGCALQLFTYAGLGGTECYLLAAMAYDRYVAICHPLAYLKIMNKETIRILLLVSYLSGFLNSFIHTVMSFFHLDFCEPEQHINHFYCDIMALVKISCGDTKINEILIFYLAGFIELSSLVVILVSYIFIIIAVLRISSSTGRKKAFSTFTCHLTVVSLFYGIVIFMYLRPSRPESNTVHLCFISTCDNTFVHSGSTLHLPSTNLTCWQEKALSAKNVGAA